MHFGCSRPVSVSRLFGYFTIIINKSAIKSSSSSSSSRSRKASVEEDIKWKIRKKKKGGKTD